MTTDTPKTEALEGVRELPELPDMLVLRALRVTGSPSPPYLIRGYTADQMRAYALAALAATPAAPRSAAPGWMPIETAPKEVELLGWREDCGPLLIMHTSFDRFATEKECDETDEETLFQKDWFGACIPFGMQRLEGSEVPTHWMLIDAPPVTPSEGGKPEGGAS